MDCKEARTLLLDRRRGTLDAARADAVTAHLAGCPACRHEEAADAELSSALERRLPRPAAPAALMRALEGHFDSPRTDRSPVTPSTGPAPVARIPRRAALARTFAAMAAGAALALAVLVGVRSRSVPD